MTTALGTVTLQLQYLATVCDEMVLTGQVVTASGSCYFGTVTCNCYFVKYLFASFVTGS